MVFPFRPKRGIEKMSPDDAGGGKHGHSQAHSVKYRPATHYARPQYASGQSIRLDVQVMSATLTLPNGLANAVPDYDHSAPAIVVSSSGSDRALGKQPFAAAKPGNCERSRQQCPIHDASKKPAGSLGGPEQRSCIIRSIRPHPT